MADELDQFDRPFHEVLNDMAKRIDPKESAKFRNLRSNTTRGFLGKAMDFLLLVRKAFGQSWRFMIIVQAIFIFLGLAPEVSKSLAVIGINISGDMLVAIAITGELFLFLIGFVMLLYGGSQRSTFLVNQKQNPAQRMDYHFYKAVANKLQEMDDRLKDIE